MSSKVIKTELYIGRDSRDSFNIEIRCDSSNVLLARVSMTAKQFAMAITGLHQGGINCEIGDLSRVGKRRVREKRQVQPPFSSYSTETCQEWLKENCQEEGWLLDSYLGSKSSMVHIAGMLTLNYSVFKFVDVEVDNV